jgi:hypothetical protein
MGGQVLTLEGKTRSLRMSFTTYIPLIQRLGLKFLAVFLAKPKDITIQCYYLAREKEGSK